MVNAFCYHRFSSARQDRGTSLERQAERTAELCRKNGWEIVEVLEDKGRSAWKGDHLRVGNLGKFKQRVDAGDIEPGTRLVIENLDRLSRQEVKFARRWIEDITDRGIVVAVCTPEMLLDADALAGDNIVSILQYLLEAKRSTGESSRKSDMLLKAAERAREKAREGTVFSARAPAWLRGEKGGAFEVIEERAAVVRQIYEWSASGIGSQAIAKKLNDTVTPWTQGYKHAAKWKLGYVRDILTSPAVEGEYHVRAGPDRTPTGEVIVGYYPRIVEAALVESARTAMKARVGSGGANRVEASNLFAGRVRCGHCGDTMVRTVQRNRQGTRYEYLKCARFNAAGAPSNTDTPEQRARKCTNSTQFRYDLFEQAALEQILHLALDNSFFIKTDDISPLAGRLADLNKEVQRIQGQQSRLLTFVMENDDAAEAKDMLDQLRPRLEKAKADRDQAESELDRAKGRVSPDEHLRRVLEVREAINSEDKDTREEARRRVRDAIQSLVSVVQCKRYDPDPDARPYRATPRREIIMAIAGGFAAYQFDGEGNLLAKHNANGDVVRENAAASASSPELIASVKRRMIKAA